MNLPNALTISRIFLVPLLLAVLLTGNLVPAKELWASAIMLIAAATDTLDGYFARRRGQVTTLGVLLDPVADKLLISAAFISLVELGAVKAWMAVIIIGREFAVSGLRSIASSQGFTIQASDLGKAKMVTQVIAVVVILLGFRYERLRLLGDIVLWLVVFFALASAVGYFRRFWRQIDLGRKESMAKENTARREAFLKGQKSDAAVR
jgi:CDP-diacylglycerol--glycerol-3-phosphate 3-phosphatidyltransferase